MNKRIDPARRNAIAKDRTTNEDRARSICVYASGWTDLTGELGVRIRLSGLIGAGPVADPVDDLCPQAVAIVGTAFPTAFDNPVEVTGDASGWRDPMLQSWVQGARAGFGKSGLILEAVVAGGAPLEGSRRNQGSSLGPCVVVAGLEGIPRLYDL